MHLFFFKSTAGDMHIAYTKLLRNKIFEVLPQNEFSVMTTVHSSERTNNNFGKTTMIESMFAGKSYLMCDTILKYIDIKKASQWYFTF